MIGVLSDFPELLFCFLLRNLYTLIQIVLFLRVIISAYILSKVVT